jgi:hypothetical protein
MPVVMEVMWNRAIKKRVLNRITKRYRITQNEAE